jgi:invasion protein IalB
MNVRILSGPGRPGARALALALALATAATTFALTFVSRGQAPAPTAPANKAQPKPKAPPTPQKPAEQPSQPPQQQAAAPQQPQMIWSPWVKICQKEEPQYCATARDGRLESGALMVAAALIEPMSQDAKRLRVTLPLGMALLAGTRIQVDQTQPLSAPYVLCVPDGCFSDYEASGELIAKMKKGQGLIVQAANFQGNQLALTVPLAEFAKANDGPPMDPKVFAEQQKKLQEDLTKRAEDARKKEAQQGPAAR